MGNRNQSWTEAKIAKKIKEGHGSGDGSNYTPWISVQESKTNGRGHRAWSPVYKRSVHLLSDVESRTFYALEFSGNFKEIYEQFPLDRKLTLEIAAARGIRHPCYLGTSIPVVMTVDFLAIDKRDNKVRYEAFDCKRTEDVNKTSSYRMFEKLEITRTYFENKGTPHRLVPHSLINERLIKNIEWIRGGIFKYGEIEPYANYYSDKSSQMLQELIRGSHKGTLSEYCRSFDERHALQPGDASRVVRILLWEHRLKCELRQADINRLPISSFIPMDELESRRAA